MATLIKKNAVPNPKKGEFYYVKNGDVYAVKPNRKGGKKGRKVCTAKPKKRKVSSLAKFRKAKTIKRPKKAAVKRKTVARKTVAKKRVTKRKK